jgi:CBS domain containing-hemolysin-like protein
MTATFWIAFAGLCVTCVAAIAARSLDHFSPHELKEIGEQRNAPNRLGHVLRWRDQVGLALETLQVLATAVFIAAATTWAWAAWQAPSGPDWLHLLASLIAAGVLLLAAEIWVPWAVARLWAGPFLYFTWPVWWAISFPLVPLVLAARFVDLVMHRLAGQPHQPPDEESFEEDIRTIVTEGHREGLLEEDAREMIEGVIELGDADVSQIMTPRTDMVSLPASLSWPELLDFVVKAGHTRIPVYGRNRDDILGVLHAKDLLAELAKPPEQRIQPWTKLLREPIFVPETKPIDALLQELQRSRNHIAVVLDEYSGVSGLVTMEDVLEEIVGEIVDEYDTALVEGIRQAPDGAWEALGRVHIDELNEQLGLDLPDEAEYDTIAGFVFSELGHIPVVGEQLHWQNVRITVLEATRRRIERVRVEVLDQARKEAV